MNSVLEKKVKDLLEGKRIITNGQELDEIEKVMGDECNWLRSIPNPRRLGILDQYEAWISKEIVDEISEEALAIFEKNIKRY